MNPRLLLLICVLAVVVTSCTLGGSKRNAGGVVQNTKPTPAESPRLSASTTQTSVATNISKDTVVVITDGNYDEVVGSRRVTLILFWAPWSAPDRLMAPVVQALANDYSETVKTGSVNVDDIQRRT